MSNIDDLIEKYADTLQGVYDNRTAGSYTFHGVLTMFLLEAEKVRFPERTVTLDEVVEDDPEDNTRYFLVSSYSDPSVSYVITENENDEALCNCPDAVIRKNTNCKHVQFLNDQARYGNVFHYEIDKDTAQAEAGSSLRKVQA